MEMKVLKFYYYFYLKIYKNFYEKQLKKSKYESGYKVTPLRPNVIPCRKFNDFEDTF